MLQSALARLSPIAGAALLFLSATAAPAATPVPIGEPPSCFAPIAPQLTAAETAVAAAGPADRVALEETFHWVGPNGNHCRVEHRVARSGGVAPAAAFYSTLVDPVSQRHYLVASRVRSPDASWQAAGEATFDNVAASFEVAFPGLAADAFAEVVVAIEEPLLPIAGELTALLTFYGELPTAASRSVVELPAAMAARLADTAVGAAPAKRRFDLGGGRVRFEWLAKNPPPGRSAAVWLTTLDSWDRLADWYRGQLRGRDDLPADLAEAAQAWTAGAATTREIAARLYRQVADRLRSAPSALGLAPSLPRRPAEVWAAGRGDSLDKAQLLHALLAVRGIASTLALVNGRQAGAVETRSPDFRHFDRALLAIEIAGEKPRGILWADLSLPFLEPGQLAPGGGDRPAFLIPAAGGFRFATTPPASPLRLSTEQVAGLAADGDPRLEAAVAAIFEGAGGAPAEDAGRLAEQARVFDRRGEEGAAGRLYLALEKAAPRYPQAAPALGELKLYFESKAAVGVHAEIARDLASLFTASPPPWWRETLLEPAPDVAAAARRLEQLEQEEKTAPFLRQAVYLLTTFPPEPDFSRRLYQLAFSFAEFYPDAPQVGPLLALMARLPKIDPNYWEGQALAGRRLLARGQVDPALALYRLLLADPALPPAFVSVFKALAAEAELGSGRLAEAGATYSELGRAADLSLPIVVDALVQAALLELEAGRPETALSHLRQLAAADPAVVERSASPQQALALRQLGADERAARRAWASSADWWPSWLELEASWPAPPGRPVAPLLGDLQQLGARFADLLARGDRSAAFEILRRLAHAGRWDPQLALELSGSLVYLASTRPDLAPTIHQTAIVLHRSLPPFAEPEAAARSRLLLAAHLIDAGRPAEALEPLRDLLALKVGGLLEQRGLTLLAMVALATGRGEEQAAEGLERSLGDGFPAELRGVAALRLAELYQRLGRPLEERRLLERETAHPAVAASPQHAELAARLAASRKGSDLLADTFAAWRDRFDLPFLAAAEPASLGDPRLAGRQGPSMLEGGWLAPEKVKIAFLAAADPKRPAEERAGLLAAVLPELRGCLPHQGVYRQMLEALALERRFPAGLRSAAAFYLVYSYLQHENMAAADDLLRRGELELTYPQRTTLEALRALPAAKAAGPAALESYLTGLLGRKMSAVEVQLLPEAWRALALLGAPGTTERLAPLLDGLRTEVGDSGFEAELRRSLRESQEELDQLGRGRAEWRARWLGQGAPQRPALLDEIASPLALEGLRPEACRALLLYDLDKLKLGLAATASWPAFFAACQDGGEAGGRVQAEIVLAVAGSPFGDARKAAALAEAAGYLADDDPAWPGLLEKLSRGTDPRREPATGRAVALLAAQRAQRRGEPADWPALRRGAGADQLALAGSWQARLALSCGDAAMARSLLEAAAPDELASPVGMLERLELLALSPGKEASTVKAAARRQAYLARLTALAHDSWSAARQAIRLEEALGEPADARGWVAGLLKRIENPLGRLSLELADAESRSDWPAAFEAARRMVEVESPDHDDLWNLGRAAFYAGKKEEAQAVLRLFLDKTRNHPAEREARRLLEQLAAP